MWIFVGSSGHENSARNHTSVASETTRFSQNDSGDLQNYAVRYPTYLPFSAA